MTCTLISEPEFHCYCMEPYIYYQVKHAELCRVTEWVGTQVTHLRLIKKVAQAQFSYHDEKKN